MAHSELKKIAAESNRYNYLGKIVEGLALLLTAIVMTRGLSVSDYGAYSILTETLKIAVLLGSLGISSIFLRYLPEYVEKKYSGNMMRLLRYGFLIHSAAQILLLALLYLLYPSLSHWLKIPQLSDFLFIFSATIFTHALVTTCTQAANGLLLQKTSNLLNASAALAKLALILYALAHGHGISGILWCLTTVNTLQLITYLFVLMKNPKGDTKIHPMDRRRLFRFGLFSYFNDTSASLFEISTDIYIIGIFLTPEHVAQYSFAALTVPLLMNWLPTRVSGNLLLPLFVRQMERTEKPREEIQYLYQLMSKALAFFAIPTVFGIMALAPEMISLVFSPKYLPGLHVFLIFAGFSFINELFAQAGVIAMLKERTDITFYSRIFTIYNLVMDLVLVGPYGIEGVAFATGTALLGKGLFIHFWVNRLTPISLPYISLGKILLESLAMLAFLSIWKHFCPITNLSLLLLAILSSAAVYFALALRFKIFAPRDRNILSAMTGKYSFPF